MKKFMLAMLAFCLTSITKAQFYTSEVFFYIKAGTSLDDNSDIVIVHFDGKNMAELIQNKSYVSKKLKENRSHWNNYMLNQDHTNYKYDSSYSTSSKTTYCYPQHVNGWYDSFTHTYITPPTHVGNEYYSFANDKSTLIIWKEKYDSNEIKSKIYYQRVLLEDLIPKPVNHDFLYE